MLRSEEYFERVSANLNSRKAPCSPDLFEAFIEPSRSPCYRIRSSPAEKPKKPISPEPQALHFEPKATAAQITITLS